MSRLIHSTILNFKDEITFVDNSVLSKKIIDRKNGKVTLFAFDKEQQLSEHTAPFDALIQVVEGVAEVVIDKQPFVLTEGMSIIMPANIPHSVYAKENFKMLLTMVKD